LLVTTGVGKGGLGQMGFQILTADHAKLISEQMIESVIDQNPGSE